MATALMQYQPQTHEHNSMYIPWVSIVTQALTVQSDIYVPRHWSAGMFQWQQAHFVEP